MLVPGADVSKKMREWEGGKGKKEGEQEISQKQTELQRNPGLVDHVNLLDPACCHPGCEAVPLKGANTCLCVLEFSFRFRLLLHLYI